MASSLEWCHSKALKTRPDREKEDLGDLGVAAEAADGAVVIVLVIGGAAEVEAEIGAGAGAGMSMGTGRMVAMAVAVTMTATATDGITAGGGRCAALQPLRRSSARVVRCCGAAAMRHSCGWKFVRL